MSCKPLDRKTLSEEEELVLQSWKILPNNNFVSVFNQEKEQEWTAPWYFIQGADPQYGLIERYINKNPIPNWDKEIELTEQLVKKINGLRPKPRFFVICGDLCDAVPTTEPQLFKEQEITFKRIFSKIDPEIPILVVCGNHDVGDNPTEEALNIYRKSWGDDYYSFWCGGVFFAVINTQYYVDSCSVHSDKLKHDSWLEGLLTNRKEGQRTVLFQHIPWFLNNAEETESGYFAVKKEVRDVMLDRLEKVGVQKAFCGHYHRTAGGSFKNLEVVVTSAIGGQLGADESGVRLVKVYKDKIEHKYYGIEQLPSCVEL